MAQFGPNREKEGVREREREERKAVKDTRPEFGKETRKVQGVIEARASQ